MKKDITDALTRQHKKLIETADKIVRLKDEQSVSDFEIYQLFVQFKCLSEQHFQLESEIFYQVLIERVKNSGDVAKYTELREFINSVNDIERSAMNFLDLYTNEKDIAKSREEFFNGFNDTFGSIALRITQEESIVYKEWQGIDECSGK